MNGEPEPLMISALQHWAYCPRQCGLIHLDQAFDDNIHTSRGRREHEIADQRSIETRAGVRVERALPLWSDELWLIGKADVVEFEPDGCPFPVEYKHGARDKVAGIAACDDLQLAAQALCLEDMTKRAVNEGAIYYATSRRRRIVPITPTLRLRVSEVIRAVRDMLESGVIPSPTADERRCQHCSLRERCQPVAVRRLRESKPDASLFDPDA